MGASGRPIGTSGGRLGTPKSKGPWSLHGWDDDFVAAGGPPKVRVLGHFMVGITILGVPTCPLDNP